jgi:vacuolar protein sorting-associated protein 54
LLITLRLIADAQLFESRISKLDGAGDLGEHILNVVKTKEVVNSSAGSATTSNIGAAKKSNEADDRPNGVDTS